MSSTFLPLAPAYLQPTRLMKTSLPTIQTAPEVAAAQIGLTSTATVQKQTQLVASPPVAFVPTLGVRGDGSVGTVGPASILPTDPGAGVSRQPPLAQDVAAAQEAQSPTFNLPMAMMPGGGGSEVQPTIAEIPGYAAVGPSAPNLATTTAPLQQREGISPWLIGTMIVLGVVGLGVGYSALTR